jgi:Cd2+/Zn2+-exporting ATPase
MKNKLEFILDGLCCSNCAMKIEKKVSDLSLVKEANVNIATQLLLIELEDGANKDEIHHAVEKIVKEAEPDVIVREKIRSKKYKEATGRSKKGEGNVHGHSHEKNHDNNDGHDHSHNHGDGDGHSHSHSQEHGIKKNLIRFGISAIFFFTALIFDLPKVIELSFFLISYAISGGEVVLRAIKNIARGEIFDENFLMSIATIGAFIIGNYPEGVAVMLFYQVGELFQDYAVSKSRNSISSLMDIRPDYANLLVDNVIKVVSPEDVQIGNHIVVKPGEKIPLDGKIIDGNSLVDTTALTGESVPREVFVGDNVLSGFINTNGVLTIEVEKDFEDSTVSKILDLVENASNKKAPTEKFITKFARVYTPIVTISALLLAIIPPLLIPSATFSEWVYRALIFLVISCPCALVVSIPLGFFGGIGGASKNGILIKGSNYLEVLNEVDTIVFDKTGTLTKGVFKVTEIESKGELSQDELLECAAYAESYSNHPIALSIMSKYGKSVNQDIIANYEEVAGKGIKVVLNGKKVLAGNSKLMDDQNIEYEPVNKNGSIIHVSIEDVYAGYIIISDELKEDSKEAINNLKASGIKNIVMLTGDTRKVGESVANELGIDKVYTDLLPNEKVEKLEQLIKERKGKEKIMFVGDGINDAPVLALSDIGVAMGGLGSDAAIEAADVVLMTDEPSKLVTAFKVAKKTRKIVWQNIIFAFGVKLLFLILGAFGLANMWEAVFADVGVALIAVLNAMRVMKVDN